MPGQRVQKWQVHGIHACPDCGCRMTDVTFISYTFDEEHIAVRVFIHHEECAERGACASTVLVNINDRAVIARVH